MRRVALDEVRLASVLDTEPTPTGTVFRRLPAWTRQQITDVLVEFVVRMPAGVRLEFETDTTELELDVMLTLLEINGRPVKPAAFDVVADGEIVASARTLEGTTIVVDMADETFDLRRGEPTTIRFADLPLEGGASVEVWLPHDAHVELRELRVADGARVFPRPEGDRRRWVHYGSSISHCAEAERPTETWPAIVARSAGLDLQNLAFAGQCVLDQTVARTIRDLPADFISIKAGINIVNGDTMRERTFVPALHGFLDTVRDGHPSTPIVLATPIICPIAEDHPGPTVPGVDRCFGVIPRPAELATGALTLRRIRAIVTEVVTSRRQAGDPNLHLVDGLQLFGEQDIADLYDNLHPTAEGYKRIGERFHSIVFAEDGPFGSG